MRVAAMVAGAVLVAAVVWISVLADALSLSRDARGWALVALAFPSAIALLARRDRG